MGKYNAGPRKKSAPTRNEVNPYMRGIGCILIVAVPVFALGLGDYLAGQGFGYPLLPANWYGTMTFPPAMYQLTGLSAVAVYLSKIKHLQATAALTLLGLVVIGGLMAVAFGYMYSLFAPSRYGPTDVPPPRIKTKKYKR